MILTIEAKSAVEMTEKLIEVAKVFGIFPKTDVAVASPAFEAPAETAGKKRGPKPKAAEPAPAPAQAEEKSHIDIANLKAESEAPAPAEEALTPPPSKDEVKAGLDKLIAVKGMPEARQLLSRYKASRMGELAICDYAPLLNDIEAVLAGSNSLLD